MSPEFYDSRVPVARPGKPYHHGNLHEQLLDAGEAVLATLPFHKVSLREIARRAGVSHAAPKHHFPTLGHLLGDLAARGYRRFVTHLAAAADGAPDQEPRQRVLAMGRAYLDFAQDHPEVYRLMFAGSGQVTETPELTAAAAAAWEQLARACGAAVGPAQAEAAALNVWSSVHGLTMLLLAHCIPPEIDRHQIREGLLAATIAGLAAPAPPASSTTGFQDARGRPPAG